VPLPAGQFNLKIVLWNAAVKCAIEYVLSFDVK